MNYKKEFKNLEAEYEKLKVKRERISVNFYLKVWNEIEKYAAEYGLEDLCPWVLSSTSSKYTYRWYYTQQMDLADLEEAMAKENCKIVFLPLLVEPAWNDTENNWGGFEMILKEEK